MSSESVIFWIPGSRPMVAALRRLLPPWHRNGRQRRRWRLRHLRRHRNHHYNPGLHPSNRSWNDGIRGFGVHWRREGFRDNRHQFVLRWPGRASPWPDCHVNRQFHVANDRHVLQYARLSDPLNSRRHHGFLIRPSRIPSHFLGSSTDNRSCLGFFPIYQCDF